MGSYAVIARTSETMLELLRERIHDRSDTIDVDRHKIALASPAEVNDDSDVRISLTLYEITKNDVMNTKPREYTDDHLSKQPPLALDLKYLLTAYPATGDDNLTPNAIDQQRLLGLAIQTLNDNGMIDGTEFGGVEFDKNVSITLQPESSENVQSMWRSYQDSSMRPSVVYTVSPILLDSRMEEEIPPVEQRGLGYEDKTEENTREEQRFPDRAK